MNPKNSTIKEPYPLSPQPKPNTIKLTNVTNQAQPAEMQSLKLRIDQLQSKIYQLQSKIRAKNKRVRRKSSEVQKKHECRYCKKMYGSLVSLNLHNRIKHKQEQSERKKAKNEERREVKQGSQKSN